MKMKLEKPKMEKVKVQIKAVDEKSESFTVYGTNVKAVLKRVMNALSA